MPYSDEKKLEIVRVFNAPVDLVWRAITEGDLVKQWAPFLGDFKTEVGAENRFLAGPDDSHQYLHICRVTDVVEGKQLTYTWAYGDVEGDSRVTFVLYPEGEQTRLDFTHEVLKPFPKNDPNFAAESFEGGWTQMIAELQSLVETH